ncbi:MAG TPA: hypothetical protein VGB44_09335 [Flavobacterium sp.]|jgi:hypothetical protein
MMKIKKCISLFLAILLLVCNTGFALTVHFCGGNIASISSTVESTEVCEKVPQPKAEKCCATKIAVDHKGCCSNNIIDLQDNTDDVVVKAFSFQLDAPFTLELYKPIVFSAPEYIPNDIEQLYYCGTNSPPLFKLYSQYIFYA